VTKEYLAAVPEPDLVLDDGHKAEGRPQRQQRAKALGAFHVVLDQIFANAAEDVDLKAGDDRAPDDGRDAHQVGLAAAGSAPVQNLGRYGVEGLTLLRVKMKVQSRL